MQKTPYNTVSDLVEAQKNKIIEPREEHPLEDFAGRYIGSWTRGVKLTEMDQNRVIALIDEWNEHQQFIRDNINDPFAAYGRTGEQADIINLIQKIYKTSRKK